MPKDKGENRSMKRAKVDEETTDTDEIKISFEFGKDADLIDGLLSDTRNLSALDLLYLAYSYSNKDAKDDDKMDSALIYKSLLDTALVKFQNELESSEISLENFELWIGYASCLCAIGSFTDSLDLLELSMDTTDKILEKLGSSCSGGRIDDIWMKCSCKILGIYSDINRFDGDEEEDFREVEKEEGKLLRLLSQRCKQSGRLTRDLIAALIDFFMQTYVSIEEYPEMLEIICNFPFRDEEADFHLLDRLLKLVRDPKLLQQISTQMIEISSRMKLDDNKLCDRLSFHEALGNAYMTKSSSTADEEEAIESFDRAIDEYQRILQLDPDQRFEITGKIVELLQVILGDE